MKLCDIRVGMLVRRVCNNEVWAVAGVVLRGNGDPETPVVLERYLNAYGGTLKDEAYPSLLKPLTEEDL